MNLYQSEKHCGNIDNKAPVVLHMVTTAVGALGLQIALVSTVSGRSRRELIFDHMSKIERSDLPTVPL